MKRAFFTRTGPDKISKSLWENDRIYWEFDSVWDAFTMTEAFFKAKQICLSDIRTSASFRLMILPFVLRQIASNRIRHSRIKCKRQQSAAVSEIWIKYALGFSRSFLLSFARNWYDCLLTVLAVCHSPPCVNVNGQWTCIFLEIYFLSWLLQLFNCSFNE